MTKDMLENIIARIEKLEEEKAADEIERLRGENQKLLKALTGLYEACRWEKVAPEIDAAKAALAKATGGE